MLAIAILLVALSPIGTPEARLLPRLASHNATSSRRLQDSSTLDVLFIGDWGFAGTDIQWSVARAMDARARDWGVSFVASVGDNFYYNGVSSTSDPQWNDNWYNVYKQTFDTLRPLPWHSVLGNHDYCGNVDAQVQQTVGQWRMDDFMWIHSTSFGYRTVAFVYIDTNLIAYGQDTVDWLLRDCPNMKNVFQQKGWTMQQMISWVGFKLDYVKNYDYIFVVGHHPLGGGSCCPEGNLLAVRQMLEAYRVTAYIYGHIHQLEFSNANNIAHIMTGAAGDPTGVGCTLGYCGSGTPDRWGMWRQSFPQAGFTHLSIAAHYTTVYMLDEMGQQIYTTQVWRR